MAFVHHVVSIDHRANQRPIGSLGLGAGQFPSFQQTRRQVAWIPAEQRPEAFLCLPLEICDHLQIMMMGAGHSKTYLHDWPVSGSAFRKPQKRLIDFRPSSSAITPDIRARSRGSGLEQKNGG